MPEAYDTTTPFACRSDIYDRERAFGSGVSVGRFEQPGRRQDQERVRELVDDARRAITESLTRELDQELPGLDEAIGA